MFDHENVRRTKVSYKKNNKKQHGYFKHSLRDLFRLDKLSMVQKKSSFPMFLNLEQEKIARGNTYYKSGTKKKTFVKVAPNQTQFSSNMFTIFRV